MCPPEMNDVALAETLIIVVRIDATQELKTKSESEKPTLQMVPLEFAGDKMPPAPNTACQDNGV